MSHEESSVGKTDAEIAQDAQQAVAQAQETVRKALRSLQSMSPDHWFYMGSMAAVVVCMLIFNMASFVVATPGVPVSETVADAQRSMEAKLNASSYSAFSSTLWGKLAWLSALGGIGLTVAFAVGKIRSGWVPLAKVGCSALATLLLLLLFFVGFPDLSAYSDANCDATWLGYWTPLISAAVATTAAAKPIFSASSK